MWERDWEGGRGDERRLVEVLGWGGMGREGGAYHVDRGWVLGGMLTGKRSRSAG